MRHHAAEVSVLSGALSKDIAIDTQPGKAVHEIISFTDIARILLAQNGPS